MITERFSQNNLVKLPEVNMHNGLGMRKSVTQSAMLGATSSPKHIKLIKTFDAWGKAMVAFPSIGWGKIWWMNIMQVRLNIHDKSLHKLQKIADMKPLQSYRHTDNKHNYQHKKLLSYEILPVTKGFDLAIDIRFLNEPNKWICRCKILM